MGLTFQDIFKRTFLEHMVDVSLVDAAMSLVVAFLLGMVIYLTYKHSFAGVIYSKNYNVSLVAVCVITSVIVITIASNILLALGMVGALSIVRFRTAVKEAMDVAYMFWAITIGIVCGAGLYFFAAVATLVVAVIFAGMNLIKEKYNKYVVIVNYHKTAQQQVQELLESTRYILRSKTIRADDVEMILEMDIKDKKDTFVSRISEIPNVTNVSLVSYKAGL